MKWQRHKSLNRSALRSVFVFFVCLGGVGTMSLQAGEPIIFPGVKSKSQPTMENQINKGLLNDSDKTPLLRKPTQPLTPEYLRPTPILLDPKSAKRLQNQQDEQRNWMFLNPGELQEKDDTSRRLEDMTLDSLEKKDASRDYTFKDLGTPKSPGPYGSKSKSQKPSPIQFRQSTAFRDDERATKASGSTEPQAGPHTNPELSLKDLLSPVPGSTATLPTEKTDAKLRDFLDLPTMSRGRDSLDRADSVSRPSGAPNPISLPASAADPINMSVDFSRQALNPLVGRTIEGPPKPAGADFLSPTRDLSRPANPLLAPSGLSASPSSVIGFSSLPSPTLRPADSSPTWKAPPLAEPPRRKF